jgi:excisionase family DNA binding protein
LQKRFHCKEDHFKNGSDACAKRLYKLNQRNTKIAHTEMRTEIKRSPMAIITKDQIETVQAKENLTLKEAAILLNISSLALRRWTLSGKVRSNKVGKKHSIRNQDLFLS